MAARSGSKDEKATYTVVGALAIVKGSDGRVAYLYRGAVVPDGVPVKEVERLEELGLIEKDADVLPGVGVTPE